jgi:two-component system alkaline phosphatase synthesis response regulator PhoP
MSKARLLLIDDSEEIHVIIKKTLTDLCEIASAYTMKEARSIFDKSVFDIVIIDLIMGGENGMDLLKEFKANPAITSQTKFFIMTGKESSVDEAQGHNYGVDEYLKKPMDREVLKAIVRKNIKNLKEEAPEVIDLPPFYILPSNHQAFVLINGEREEMQLTVKEFKLLVKLVTNPDKTFSREDLFSQVWDNDSNSTFRTIDMHVSSLRKKLKEHGVMIKTVHQVGYKLSIS